MQVDSPKAWRIALWTAVAIWLAFAVRLMIADVWDETNGMLAFSSPAMSLGQKLQFVLTQSLGFWRPLPTLLVTVVLHFVRDFDVSWKVLRAINMAMLLGAVTLLARGMQSAERRAQSADSRHPLLRSAVRALRSDSPEARRFVLVVALLFSGSAVITAGWYANIFDASALLLIAIALTHLFQGRDLAAGVILGVAFFCKETAALALPFLLILFATGKITFRNALRAGIPATILGAIYFAIRSKIVPFGGTGDVHGFAPEHLLPTFVNLAESFWRQTLKADAPGILGFVFLAISLIALKRPRVIGAAILFLVATALIYWGMFSEYQAGVLMHHLNFVGRLYLVPVALMLFLLAIEERTWAIAVLLLPIVFGAFTTWRDHARFQSTYARIYRTARDASVKPLVVHYPPKPLEDTVRGVRVGDFPEAPVKVDAKSGRLLFD